MKVKKMKIAPWRGLRIVAVPAMAEVLEKKIRGCGRLKDIRWFLDTIADFSVREEEIDEYSRDEWLHPEDVKMLRTLANEKMARMKERSRMRAIAPLKSKAFSSLKGLRVK